jgi:hypothetical protein
MIEDSQMVQYPSEPTNLCATLEISEEGFLPHASYEPEAILSDGNRTTGV